MVSHLEASSQQDHGSIEEFIRTEGDELLRRLLQGYLDKQTHEEQPLESVTCADHQQRNHVRQGTSRSITSLFGPVTLKRLSYSQRQLSSVFPLDAELSLNSHQYSDGVHRRIVTEVIDRSYDRAVHHHRDTCAGRVGKRQAIALAKDASQDFEAFYQQCSVNVEPTEDLLVLSFDGKGIVMHPEGLREATRKNAEKNSKKKQTRLSPGEKRDRKRMAQVATIYTVKPNHRTAESIISLDQKDEKIVRFRPPVRNKRVWASVERSAEEVIEEAFTEAAQRDPEKKRQWVIVVDGHPHQLKLIEKIMRKNQVQAVVVMDFIHVLEYLWKAAHCLHDKKDKTIENWVAKRALKVLKGQCSQVAKGIRQSASKRKLEKREAIDKCADYLLKNKSRLRYDEALSEGFPIASGVIEGACRHLINDRMDITGARWSLEGAEAVLKLRSVNSSGDWDSYWAFHKSRSKSRNYGGIMHNQSS